MGDTRPTDWQSTALSASHNSPQKPLLHARTALLAARVEAAKAQKLTVSEWICSKGLGTLLTLPFLGLTGLTSVPTNTTLAIFRFGKLDRVIKKPGLVWIAPIYERVQSFGGTQTHKMDSINVLDASGNPLIIRALLEYAVTDPASLFIATDNSTLVLFNMAEQVVREAVTKLPLLGEKGHDIRSQFVEIGESMASELQKDASVFGVYVQRLCIVEARYAPEIAGQMLMKQQASALVAARKEIVAGALGVVRDALADPTMAGVTNECRERLISNLLVTLTSHQPATPVLHL